MQSSVMKHITSNTGFIAFFNFLNQCKIVFCFIVQPGTPKQMTSKSGKPLKKCEVKLTDEGCPTFSLFL